MPAVRWCVARAGCPHYPVLRHALRSVRLTAGVRALSIREDWEPNFRYCLSAAERIASREAAVARRKCLLDQRLRLKR